MKKFMILLLSLAVLFSFAACDNNSSAPENPTDDTTVISETALMNAAGVINDLLEGSKYSVQALIGDEWTASQAVDGKFIAIDDEDEGNPALKINPTKVTLTINSVNNKTEGAVTTYNLNKFTYVFSTDTIGADGNHAVLSGTLTGYIAADDIADVATMAVSTADGTTKVTIDDTNAKVVMFEAGSISDVKIGEEAADADDIAYLYNLLIDSSMSWSNVTLYDAYYKDTLLKGQQDAIKAYADALIADATSVFQKIGSATVADTDLTRDVSISEDGKIATVTFKNGGKTAYAISGADATELSIPAGQSVTFTVTGTTSSDTFTMDTTSTFTVASSVALQTPDSDTEIAAITLDGVKGTIKSGTWAFDADADTVTISTLGTVEITEAKFTASNVPVGPAMVDASTETAKGVVAYAPETVTYEIKPTV